MGAPAIDVRACPAAQHIAPHVRFHGSATARLTPFGELAFREPAGSALVAEVGQQDLADLVGSPRTSVARILAELREEGILRTVPRGIHVLRPERLLPNRVETVAI